MEFLSLNSNKSMGSVNLKFLPTQVPGLIEWNRFNTGITEIGLGVDQWDDQSGNGNHLIQTSDANRPSKEVDGSILFDGVDEHMQSVYTLNQPEIFFILLKAITWTLNDTIFDGTSVNTGKLSQTATTPDIKSYAGSFLGPNTELILGSYFVLTVEFNGTSSSIRVNKNTPITGDAGAVNMGGLTLGTRGDLAANWSNIQVKEVIGYNVVLDAETKLKNINHLSDVGGLSL